MIHHNRSAWVPDQSSTDQVSLRHRYVYLVVAGTEVPTPIGKEWERIDQADGVAVTWTELSASTLRVFKHRAERTARRL